MDYGTMYCTQIRIVQDGSDANQARPSSRDNSNILPGVLARLALSMMGIIQIGNGHSQRLNPRRWSIFTTAEGDID